MAEVGLPNIERVGMAHFILTPLTACLAHAQQVYSDVGVRGYTGLPNLWPTSISLGRSVEPNAEGTVT